MASEAAFEPKEGSMEVVYVEDPGGAKMKLQLIDGQYYPTFPTEVIRNLHSLKIREDDVVLAGYLKTGTHWVWEILRMLLAGSTEVSDAEKDQGMIEQTEQSVLDAMPSPRVLNTHIVYLTRNPKDVAVSLYHHHKKLQDYYCYDGTFENYLHLFVEGKVDYGSWFKHIKNWSVAARQSDLMVLEVNYEDMSKNPTEQIQRMAAFLDLNPSDDLINSIKSECSLDRMRDKKGKYDLDAEGKSIMYRKGQVGDWKNYFNDTTNSWFDAVYQKEMAAIETTFHWAFELE
ncbi:unnamed protein product [Candidula unifasciata]|uniref:Sulfotransferase domain-containing protein n=1 Tax=Candidula unifasciata TaxID=100452 RepID=A0A8S3YWS6_9EUPU|nr:unnamed protein product [Candidula unifasciata]